MDADFALTSALSPSAAWRSPIETRGFADRPRDRDAFSRSRDHAATRHRPGPPIPPKPHLQRQHCLSTGSCARGMLDRGGGPPSGPVHQTWLRSAARPSQVIPRLSLPLQSGPNPPHALFLRTSIKQPPRCAHTTLSRRRPAQSRTLHRPICVAAVSLTSVTPSERIHPRDRSLTAVPESIGNIFIHPHSPRKTGEQRVPSLLPR
jgi:hypothetical protein